MRIGQRLRRVLRDWTPALAGVRRALAPLDGAAPAPDITAMMNLISILIGLAALAPILFALLPLLGWANWFILPLPVLGFIIGSLAHGKTGRNLNLILIVVAVLRLMLGHGLL